MGKNTLFPQKSTCLAVRRFSRCQASKVDNPIHHQLFFFKIKHNFSIPEKKLSLIFQRLQFSCRNMVVYGRISPRDSPSHDPFPYHRKFWIWILGTIIFSILISFSRGKWGPLLLLKEKVETTIDKAEHVLNIVEEVAERVDKVAEKAVKHLPKGKLHDAAQFVEKVAEDLDKHAKDAENVLEKVENMEKKLESYIQATSHHDENTITPTESRDKRNE